MRSAPSDAEPAEPSRSRERGEGEERGEVPPGATRCYPRAPYREHPPPQAVPVSAGLWRAAPPGRCYRATHRAVVGAQAAGLSSRPLSLLLTSAAQSAAKYYSVYNSKP